MGEMLQHSDHFRHPLLNLLQQFYIFCWEAPSSMHCCRWVLTRAEESRENHLPRPADHASFYTTYLIVHFLATGKVYVQFFTHHYHQTFPYRDALISSSLAGTALNPKSTSLMKTWIILDPVRIDLWETLYITDLHLDGEPFMITLQTWPSSHFVTHLTVHQPNKCILNLVALITEVRLTDSSQGFFYYYYFTFFKTA